MGRHVALVVLLDTRKHRFGPVCTTLGKTWSAYIVSLPHGVFQLDINRLFSKCLVEGKIFLLHAKMFGGFGRAM